MRGYQQIYCQHLLTNLNPDGQIWGCSCTPLAQPFAAQLPVLQWYHHARVMYNALLIAWPGAVICAQSSSIYIDFVTRQTGVM